MPEATQQPEKVPYLIDSGRMSARLFAEAGKTDQADQAWEQLATIVDASPKLDGVLDEWARFNLQHERYDQSDEIYRKLVDRFPKSSFVSAARLSLAESEMQANRLDEALREFVSIATNEAYSEEDREAALYHVVDIYAAQRDWPNVMKYAEMFGTDFSASKHAPMIQLLYCEALLDQKKFSQCRSRLESLRSAVLDGKLAAEDWTERTWVVLAELALSEKRYADVDAAAEELEKRSPDSRFLFQIRDVQGRRWKSQAPPDFARARDYFSAVVKDKVGGATETAARCQFLIGETLLMEKDYAAAVSEYYRVYLNYPFDDLRVRALYQAAQCETKLGKKEEAQRSYRDLINDFPTSELAAEARQQLTKLEAS